MKSHPTIGLGVAVVAVMLASAFPGTVFGATVTVNTTVDAVGMDTQCSLREAITAANNDSAPFGGPGECAAGSGADQVLVPPGTFELSITGPPEDSNASGDLDVAGTQLLITGAGAATSTIDANQFDRILEVLAGTTLTIEGVTLTGGRARDGTGGPSQPGTGGAGTSGANGGGILNAGSLAILDSTISSNRAGDGGNGGPGQGASPPPQPTGQDGGIGTGGVGGDGGDGGGIFSSGNLALTRVTVLGNTAGKGGTGGIGTGGQGGFGTSSASGTGGEAFGGDGGEGGSGGGVASDTGASVSIDRSRIAGNSAGAAGNGGLGQGGDGGINSGMRNAGNGGAAVGGTGGTAGQGGGVGAIESLVLTRSLVEGNASGAGGHGGSGNAGDGGAQTEEASGGNGGPGAGGRGSAGGTGGGVWAGGATIVNSTITDNETGNGGEGGVANAGDGGDTLATTGPLPGSGGNATGGIGGSGGSAGGVGTFGASAVIRHATIVGNTLGAPGFGGSASAGSGGNPGGQNGNAGTQGPGSAGSGGALRASHLALFRTTIANTVAHANTAPSCSGILTDGQHNISFPDASCFGANVDPQLGELADNGGPTRTHAVGPGSPAFDAVPATGADCPATDQRGVTRPHGQGCEIGAFEHAEPDVTTGDATGISLTGATLEGQVNPNGVATTHHFEFGTTTAYGSSTPSQDAGSGVGAVAVSAPVTGLTPDTTYHYRLVGTSANGTTLGADRTFTTVDPPPRILSASLTRKVFAVLRRGRAGAVAKKGTTFRYTLSEAARVTFRIQRAAAGRRVRGRCRKPTRANRSRPRCKRFVRAGSFAAASVAGANRKKFSGRIRGRALRPARYRATLVATDDAGNASAPKRLAFRIVRR